MLGSIKVIHCSVKIHHSSNIRVYSTTSSLYFIKSIQRNQAQLFENMSFKIFCLFVLAVAGASGKTAQLRFSRDHLIVGGEEAVPHEVPSILNMGYHSCGATLIHPKWALTAAHCIPIQEVVAGDHDMYKNEGTEQKRKVIRNIRHPKYQSPNGFSNDVALLELESEFEMNDFVQVAKLAPRGFSPVGNSLVAGWGTTEHGRLPDQLHKVSVPLVSNEQCSRSYGGSGYSIDESMICAGKVNRDSCQGDSGGPLFCDSENGRVHCGIVSWGLGCGLDGYPGVYGRTSQFIDWIEESVGAHLV